MNCVQCERDSLLEQSGELPWWRARAVRVHRMKCAHCREYQTAVPALSAQVLAELAVEPPELVVRRVLRAAEPVSTPPAPVWHPAYLRMAACAALVLLLLGATVPVLWVHGHRQRDAVRQFVRIVETGSILSLALESDEQIVESVHVGDPKALARQLLELEGLSVEEIDPDEMTTEPAEYPPTVLRWHSNPAAPVGRCG